MARAAGGQLPTRGTCASGRSLWLVLALCAAIGPARADWQTQYYKYPLTVRQVAKENGAVLGSVRLPADRCMDLVQPVNLQWIIPGPPPSTGPTSAQFAKGYCEKGVVHYALWAQGASTDCSAASPTFNLTAPCTQDAITHCPTTVGNVFSYSASADAYEYRLECSDETQPRLPVTWSAYFPNMTETSTIAGDVAADGVTPNVYPYWFNTTCFQKDPTVWQKAPGCNKKIKV